MLGLGSPAQAGPDLCISNGTVATCTGDQSGGIASGIHFPATHEALIVNTLTGDITPALGVDGISFESAGGVSIESDTSGFAIVTNGDEAEGIRAMSFGTGDVTVDHTGDITTHGMSSNGIFAGRDLSVTASGNISVSSEGTISTEGDQSNAIFADGILGDVNVTHVGDLSTKGFGASGIAVNANFSGDIAIAHTGGIATEQQSAKGIQAFGDGNITVTQTGDIDTKGGNAAGIDVYSNEFGDVSVTQTGDISTKGSKAAAINAGSSGGEVVITQTGTITTNGDDSVGIFAESGGGDITLDLASDIKTFGASAEAIRVEIDSGPGEIDLTLAGDIETEGDASDGIDVESDTGNVTVQHTGDITTKGDNADGIVAESESGDILVDQEGDISTKGDDAIDVNSDNGDAVVIQTGDITTEGEDDEAITVDSNTGDIAITQTGKIVTSGNSSEAIYAETGSVGEITINQTGTITTNGNDSIGIFAESGGGNITLDLASDIKTFGASAEAIRVEIDSGPGEIDLTLAGDIETEGDASDGIDVESDTGNVTVQHTGDITTIGESADGIVAESESGDILVDQEGDISTKGDDAIDVNSDNGDAVVIQTGDITTEGENDEGITVDSKTGDIAITQKGKIVTSGEFSEAIYAETGSVGEITIAQTGTITTDGGMSYGIHAFSEGTGNIDVTQTGTITTLGEEADGIKAESIGGDITVVQTGDINILSVTGTGADGIEAKADAGNVSVTQTGDILVKQDNGEGIEAEAYGGGNVTVNHNNGSITVEGDSGDGISVGAFDDSGNFGDSTVNLNNSAIVSTLADGVEFRQGTNNTLNTYNVVSIDGGTSADIFGSIGNETINNYGWLTTPGDIKLGDGVNAFHNMTGATFNSGDSVDLGPTAGNTLTNDGVLSPGGVGAVQTTALTGDLVLGAGGVFAVDVDLTAAMTDQIDMTAGGGQADANGGVALTFADLTLPAGEMFNIVETDQTVLSQALTLLNPAVDADIDYVGLDTDVQVTINGFDLAAADLNQNQTNIADNLNEIFSLGSGALDPMILGLINTAGLDAYRDAIDQLSPEIYGDLQIAALFTGLDFSEQFLSCPVGASITGEGQCVWMGGGYRAFEVAGTDQSIGFDEQAGLFSLGAQFAIDTDWRIGLGGGYQTSSIDGDAGTSSDGDMVLGGASVKYVPGAFELAGVVSGGHGWYDTTRVIAFNGFSDVARGQSTVDLLSGRILASYTFENSGGSYFKPIFDASVSRVGLGDVRENDQNAAGLSVRDDNQTVFTVSPGVEVGANIATEDGTVFRPYLRGGVSWFSQDEIGVSATFSGAPDGVSPFIVGAAMDDIVGNVSAGFDVIGQSNMVLRVLYKGSFGETVSDHGASVKGSISF